MPNSRRYKATYNFTNPAIWVYQHVQTGNLEILIVGEQTNITIFQRMLSMHQASERYCIDKPKHINILSKYLRNKYQLQSQQI